ncbi:uncharacterized protein N7515_008299 [Penicillium bovifimosum]|uniref:Uncharacterized protein n=1 Tax=Penicillium bovifimosum TaxID=126998 RepID=A0A9W9GN16_9EURO|nr:uncharacterized protein N7515_008299 [Penicillium bovifimosum]KAJ5124474.1 hypothetical protein N7515_008299 [Penicillium bovifimosum]
MNTNDSDSAAEVLADLAGLDLGASDSHAEADLVDETRLASGGRSSNSWASNPDTTANRSNAARGQTSSSNARTAGGNVAHILDNEGSLSYVDIPTDEDDMETAANKMETIAEMIVTRHKLHISDRPTRVIAKQRARQHSRDRMKPEELNMWEAWIEHRFQVRSFPWNMELPFADHAMESLRGYALAMDTVWGHKNATPGNAAWCLQHMRQVVPLLKAVIKARTAEEYILRYGLDLQVQGPQKYEMETMWVIHEAGERCLVRAGDWHRQADTICSALAVIRNRVHQIIRPAGWWDDYETE